MDLTPQPILEAAANYRGEFVDLDAHRAVAASAFHTGCERLQARLKAQGLVSGERAVVAVGNGPDFVATLLAVLAVGGSPVLVHPRAPAPSWCERRCASARD